LRVFTGKYLLSVSIFICIFILSSYFLFDLATFERSLKFRKMSSSGCSLTIPHPPPPPPPPPPHLSSCRAHQLMGPSSFLGPGCAVKG
jgi:hypothetical protein